MILKKGDQQIELTMDDLHKLAHAIVDLPAGVWTGTRIIDQDVDLMPMKKVGGRVPEDGDEYWCIDVWGCIVRDFWHGGAADCGAFESGNAYWRKAEAEAELARRQRAYEERNGD